MRAFWSMATIGTMLIMAGCAAKPADVSGSQGPTAPTGAVPDDVAALVGKVLSKELEPIPNAQLAVASGSVPSTTSAADGSFMFTGLAPGKDVVYVSALGFQSLARKVDLVGGQQTELTLVLDKVAASGPYSALEVHKGFISCGTGTGTQAQGQETGLTQVQCGQNDPNQKFLFTYNITSNVSGVLFEMTWKPTQVLSKDLSLIVEKKGCGVTCDTHDTFAEIQGCCYLRVGIPADNLTLPAGALPAVDLRQGGTLQTRTFPAFGDSQSPMTVFTSQDFYVYVETFYNGLPSDFATRSNIPL